MTLPIPTVSLNNGLKLPIIGLGTWKSKPNEVTDAVKAAIDIGYRHFDCAHVYQNEKEVGDAINDKIAEGVIKREDIWVTSKLWNTHHRKEAIEGALQTTLNNLGLDYLDLYLIHWPMGFQESDDLFPLDPETNEIQVSNVDYLQTWEGLEDVYKKGLTRSIGVSNFNSNQLYRLLENCKIKPAVNQIECHPYLTQKRLSAICKEQKIIVTAYSPLGSPDRPWAKPDEPSILEDPTVKEIASRLGKTPAQVLIKYQIQLGHVVIPKSVCEKRIRENLQVFNFTLTFEDMKALDGLEKNERVCFDSRLKNHIYYPFNIPF